ncbi:MAG: HAD family hydrolase [Candidatus Thermoplasmatota archaeon]
MMRAVLFDLGNTLVTTILCNEEIMQRILMEKGIEKDLDEIYRARALAAREAMKRDLPMHEFYARWNSLILSKMGIEDASMGRYICERWYERAELRLYEDVIPTLKELRSRGLKLGTITNGFEEEVADVMSHLPIDTGFFDIIVGCDTTGAEKPDPQPFLHAASRLGMNPEDALFVGDSYEKDYLGALGTGMRALLILREGELPAPEIAYIRRLEEVLEHL